MGAEKILDDIAKVAGGGVSILSGVRNQIRGDIQSRIDDLAQRMDLVPREDFERLEAVLIETRRQCEDLKARIESLEKAKKKK